MDSLLFYDLEYVLRDKFRPRGQANRAEDLGPQRNPNLSSCLTKLNIRTPFVFVVSPDTPYSIL